MAVSSLCLEWFFVYTFWIQKVTSDSSEFPTIYLKFKIITDYQKWKFFLNEGPQNLQLDNDIVFCIYHAKNLTKIEIQFCERRGNADNTIIYFDENFPHKQKIIIIINTYIRK